MSKSSLLRQTSLVVLATGLAMGASAQEEPSSDSELRAQTITVTATRRAESVQDIPLNIAALGGEQIEAQGFDELADVLAYVPGINVVDRGGRQAPVTATMMAAARLPPISARFRFLWISS
jgi:iron complex outermembrane recepter protein